jgi:hypothetical protein
MDPSGNCIVEYFLLSRFELRRQSGPPSQHSPDVQGKKTAGLVSIALNAEKLKQIP